MTRNIPLIDDYIVRSKFLDLSFLYKESQSYEKVYVEEAHSEEEVKQHPVR